MEKAFWEERWSIQRIGFHLDTVNPFLKEHLPKLNLKKDDEIFLPLCGKSLDIPYLLKNEFKVLGNEFVSKAIEDFEKETLLLLEEKREGGVHSFSAKNLTLFAHDFYHLNEVDALYPLNDVKAIFDRAALVSQPPEKRKEYVETLKKYFTHPSLKILLVSFSGPKEDGPPFMIEEKEIRELFQDFKIDLLQTEEDEVTGQDGKTKYPMKTKAFLLSR